VLTAVAIHFSVSRGESHFRIGCAVSRAGRDSSCTQRGGYGILLSRTLDVNDVKRAVIFYSTYGTTTRWRRSPPRLHAATSQLRAFIDTHGPIWSQGKLAIMYKSGGNPYGVSVRRTGSRSPMKCKRQANSRRGAWSSLPRSWRAEVSRPLRARVRSQARCADVAGGAPGRQPLGARRADVGAHAVAIRPVERLGRPSPRAGVRSAFSDASRDGLRPWVSLRGRAARSSPSTPCAFS
jgi:hypothetical protein